MLLGLSDELHHYAFRAYNESESAGILLGDDSQDFELGASLLHTETAEYGTTPPPDSPTHGVLYMGI